MHDLARDEPRHCVQHQVRVRRDVDPAQRYRRVARGERWALAVGSGAMALAPGSLNPPCPLSPRVCARNRDPWTQGSRLWSQVPGPSSSARCASRTAPRSHEPRPPRCTLSAGRPTHLLFLGRCRWLEIIELRGSSPQLEMHQESKMVGVTARAGSTASVPPPGTGGLLHGFVGYADQSTSLRCSRTAVFHWASCLSASWLSSCSTRRQKRGAPKGAP